MLTLKNLIRRVGIKTLILFSLAITICLTAIACDKTTTNTTTNTAPSVGIAPEKVVDYIHTTLAADRTAYTKHVVNRVKTLEGKVKDKGVLDIEATEAWIDDDGIPLPAQMFRLGSEVAAEYAEDSGLSFSYNLISTWYINDSHGPKSEFEKTAMEQVNETGKAYKGYQEIAGQQYFSALYPDIAVAEACVTCHNTHPIHLERYPDKVFEMGDVMGGVIINLPLEKS